MDRRRPRRRCLVTSGSSHSSPSRVSNTSRARSSSRSFDLAACSRPRGRCLPALSSPGDPGGVADDAGLRPIVGLESEGDRRRLGPEPIVPCGRIDEQRIGHDRSQFMPGRLPVGQRLVQEPDRFTRGVPPAVGAGDRLHPVPRSGDRLARPPALTQALRS